MSDYPPLSSLSITEALDDIPDIAFVYRGDGLLMAMNDACERLTGVPRSAAVGVFNLLHNELILDAALVAGYRGAFAGSAQVVPATAVRIGAQQTIATPFSRETFWLETTLFPLARRPDGTAAYVMGLQRDVTEMMQARSDIEAARKQIDIQQETIDSLEAARREIESQRATIEALSTPVIEVWDGVLTLPLLGHYNADRAARMTAQVLDAVARTRARHVILDLTGVAVFDATTGDNLLRIVGAIRLLGATGILVGIQASVAQLLVGLGVGLQDVRVYQDLRQALKACMREHAAA
ncbi:STAS domain-containing protein [Nannocystis radixulma]|uniref:STAS domain-containing protein n=1 Tax=Nannocystis radixulma TaxID=2995305 RepID=A0ABT5BF89_9BACT|nr:STAS domain-containing protein [Nannocystis radixulma]MDC0672098.1 STAS domain-containing protein [Nannocystis radixulma]